MPARDSVIVGLILCALAAAPASAQSPANSANAEPPPQGAPTAIEPRPTQQPSSSVGFAQEFSERLAAGASVAAGEREDRAALARFYAARQQEPVWVTPTGITPAAEAAIAEIGRADDWGLDVAALRLPAAPSGAGISRAQQADAEIALSLAILKYARHARGGRAEPATLSKYLDRKLPLRDPEQVIGEAAKIPNPDSYLRSLHPQHPQFEALRQKYLALKRGQTVASTDAAAADDGKKGGKKKPTTPSEPQNLRSRLLINMEQWRWMPEQLGDFYVWVNVPEFTLRVVKDGKVIHTERVVAGKIDTQTPVFSAEMEQIIFHPSWGVPESIKRQDVLPSLVRGSTRIFTFYHLRIQRNGRDIDPASVDWATADIRNYHVYQPPGENNVLGNIKFRFPNKHDVYMHDTPNKSLFNAQVRAFSHGCMRVRNPQRLAEVLLAEDQGWPAERVAAAINGGPQNNAVNISRKIPVHITYFTAAVDDAGDLKLFPDIYGHESRIALGMEGKAHLIPRSKEDKGPIRAEAIGQLAESGTTSTMRTKKQWINRAFENN